MSGEEPTESTAARSVASAAELAVEATGVVKRFGAVVANRDVSLRVRFGEIHAVVGENGAGKSTLMSILGGYLRADSGALRVCGMNGGFRSPRAAARHGVGMVHQDFSLAPDLSVLDNIVLGWERAVAGVRRRHEERARVSRLLDEFGATLPLDAKVADLDVAHRQHVEIVKVLFREAQLLMLDEPTAVLTPAERDALFTALRRLAHAGKAIILVGHRLSEIIDIADTITVMRAGTTVAVRQRGTTDARELASLIVGQHLDDVPVHEQAPGPTVLTAEQVDIAGTAGLIVRDTTLTVSAGRVVGLAGLAGSGQTELIEACAGLRPIGAGALTISAGETIETRPDTSAGPDAVKRRRAAGVAWIPQDRRASGSLSGRPLWRSLLPLRWVPGAELDRFDPSTLRAIGRRLITGAGVVTPSVDTPPDALSGGNLQKYIVARELSTQPLLVLAEDPTRGVDIGSATAIRGELRAAAERGAAVVLASTDLEELLEICDEILVMYAGTVVARYARNEVTMDQLGRALTGVTDD